MEENKFLYKIARHIFTDGKQLFDNKDYSFENTLIVLPNKRAIRFLYEYIDLKDNQVIFLPDILSIDEMVKKNIFELTLADKLPLLYTLYKSYCKIYYKYNPVQENEKESFTDFYFWGGVLLNDFDELDKNLVNVKVFYRNIEEYKQLEASPDEYLTNEQKELLSRFFNIDFLNDNSVIENFVKIWNCLYEIYEDFNASLREQGIAYSGLIYREFASKLEKKEISFPYINIYIAGFSVLNNAEKKIFRLLKEQYQVEFLWDFDEYYTDNIANEAGIFIRENLSLFPMPKTFATAGFNQIRNNPEQQINIIKSSYASFSLTYIRQWLEEIDYLHKEPSDIAIVLLDESLLPLVLKSIPEDVKVNITMGYPFKQTLLYNDLLALLSKWIKQGLDKQEIDKDIRNLAQEILDSGDKERFWQLDVLKSLNEELLSFVDSLDFFDRKELSEDILLDVLKKYLNRESVDLISDATEGIQVMGLLETRALDFRYVLMLSCTDENLPKVSSDSSFIPFSFKEAFNMMSVKRRVGVFAYYFYRLMHTPERMDFVYTTAIGDKMQEMSRFLRQIKIEMSSLRQINEKTLLSSLPMVLESKEYVFDMEDMKFIKGKGTKGLSASALNKLIDCEKKFYLSVIKGLSEEIKDEEYVKIAFGNLFHYIANEYYEQKKKLIKQTDDKDYQVEELIVKIMKDARTNPYDQNQQAREYNNRQKDLNCLEELHFLMLEKYLRDLIELDLRQGNVYLGGELPLTVEKEIDGVTIQFKSRLDRIDKDRNGNYRIVDYKTGKKDSEGIGELLSIFNEDYEHRTQRTKRSDYVFEILFYCWLVYNQPTFKKGSTLKPLLLYLSDMENNSILIGKKPDKQTLVYDEQLNEDFEQELKRLVLSLISKPRGETYRQTPDNRTCEYCDFRLLCNR